MKFKKLNEEYLQQNSAYMLRNDGKLFKVKVHPYIWYDVNDPIEDGIEELFVENSDFLIWIYEHTNKQTTRDMISQLVAFVRYYGEEISSLFNNINPENFSSDFSIINYEPYKDDIKDIREAYTLYETLNNEVNQEFCRVRVGGEYLSDENSYDVYFRIGSVGFNWFNLIWKLVYDNRANIDTVTIETDYQSGKPIIIYRHNGLYLDHLSADDFISLKGNPVLESSFPKSHIDICLANGGTLMESLGSFNYRAINNGYNLRRKKLEKEGFVI